jgi:hypothetical protein
MTEPDRALDESPAAVRTAMGEAFDHPIERALVDEPSVKTQDPSYPAHGPQAPVVEFRSTNQTRIGRSKVTEATLEAGATLTVGDVELVLRADARRTSVMPSDSALRRSRRPSIAMRSIFGARTHCTVDDGARNPRPAPAEPDCRAIHSKARARAISSWSSTAAPSLQPDRASCSATSGGVHGSHAARAAPETAGHGTLFLDEVGERP